MWDRCREEKKFLLCKHLFYWRAKWAKETSKTKLYLVCSSWSLTHLTSWFFFLASIPLGPSHLYKHHNNNYRVSGDLNILDVLTSNKYRTFHKGLAWLSRSGSVWHIPCVSESLQSLSLLIYGNGHPTNARAGNKTCLVCQGNFKLFTKST